MQQLNGGGKTCKLRLFPGYVFVRRGMLRRANIERAPGSCALVFAHRRLVAPLTGLSQGLKLLIRRWIPS
jgi:hypothetical protein